MALRVRNPVALEPVAVLPMTRTGLLACRRGRTTSVLSLREESASDSHIGCNPISTPSTNRLRHDRAIQRPETAALRRLCGVRTRSGSCRARDLSWNAPSATIGHGMRP